VPPAPPFGASWVAGEAVAGASVAAVSAMNSLCG
jgi:hypothetical protein